MKIIFDTFERALLGTDYEKNIRELFKYRIYDVGEFRPGTRAVGIAPLTMKGYRIFMGSIFKFKALTVYNNRS